MANPTGQQIVSGAMTALGVLEPSGTPGPSDSQDLLNELNIMWDAWGVDEGLIYAIITERFNLTSGVAFYTAGPNGAINTALPQRIYEAIAIVASGGAISTTTLGNGGIGYAVSDTGVILGNQGTQATYTVNSVSGTGAVLTYTISGAGTGYQAGYGYATAVGGGQPGTGTGFTINVTGLTTTGGQQRIPLKIVGSQVYYNHRDLSAQAATPDELYPDYNPDVNGFERLYLWPVPNVSTLVLELVMAQLFSQWSLTVAYNIPPGLQDAIQYALAWRALPRFGQSVSQETQEQIQDLATKAEARIRDAIAKNRQIPAQAVQPAGEQATPAGGQ